MVINIVTIDGLITGATLKKADGIEGFVDVTWQGKTRRFTEHLIHQLPTKEVVDWIKLCFEK